MMLLAVLVVLCSTQARAEASFEDDFEQRLAADLETRDPGAVAAFEAGNAAREDESWAAAVSHFGEAVAIDPEFFHAERRLCGALSNLGEHDEARRLCRSALEKAETPENQASLMTALAADPDLGSSYGAEIAALAERVMDGPMGRDPELLPAICHSTFVANRIDLLERCHGTLSSVAGDQPQTHLIGWMLAMSKGELGDAEDAIDAAEAAGLDPQTVAELRAMTESAEPWWWGVARWLGIAIAIWLGTFAVLVVIGIGLSLATSRSAESLPTARTGSASGATAMLRRLYAFVLVLTCGFYYASLPLMLVLVVVLAGGIVFGMLAVGHISIKLVVILLVGTLAIVGALFKSLFVRVEDEDPGERVDLGKAPKLRAVLDEVAAKVGTRPVDNVYLSPGADIAVFERGSALEKLSGRSERCFILGVAVLDGMSARQLKAILAHEYGHFSNRDTAGGGLALAARRSMILFAEGLAREGMATPINPSWLFVSSFYKLFLRISQGASRLQEVLADRWAVYSYGAEAFEGGLRHVIDRELRFDMDTDAYLEAVVESKQPLRNLYEESLGHVSDDPEAGIEARVQEIIEAEPSPFDSHPRPLDRFRWAHALECDPPDDADGDADAWSVVGAKEVLQLQMTEFVRSNVARNMNIEIPAEQPEPEEEA